MNYHETVDADPTGAYKGTIGFVPTLLEKAAPSGKGAVALTCGPPIMINFTLPVLQVGFAHENIITSLEMRMKCGIGKCGRCNIGHNTSAKTARSSPPLR